MSEIMAKESSAEPEFGELAQLVERCDRTAEVRGSSPLFSTFIANPLWAGSMNWHPDAEALLKEVPFSCGRQCDGESKQWPGKRGLARWMGPFTSRPKLNLDRHEPAMG